MNSDITKLYLEGVHRQPSNKDESKWKSMREQYLQDILLESGIEKPHTLKIILNGTEEVEHQIDEKTKKAIETILKRLEKGTENDLDTAIKDLITKTGFATNYHLSGKAGEEAKGTKFLRMVLHYIFNDTNNFTSPAEALNLLEKLADKSNSRPIEELIKTQEPFSLYDQATTGNFSKSEVTNDFFRQLHEAKPTKQPNVGDGEFMLCSFFNLIETPSSRKEDSSADLITYNDFTVEVKGTDARMGSGTDSYAFTVWKDSLFQKRIAEHGGRRVAIAASYNAFKKIVARLDKDLEKLINLAAEKGFNYHVPVTELANLRQTFTSLDIDGIDFDTVLPTLTQTLERMGTREDWRQYKGAINIVSDTSNSKNIIPDLRFIVQEIPRIKNYDPTDDQLKAKKTAAHYGHQIYAWVRWVLDSIEQLDQTDPEYQEKREEWVEELADGLLHTSNWKVANFEKGLGDDMKEQITMISRNLLEQCANGVCPLDPPEPDVLEEGRLALGSPAIDALVCAIQVFSYWHKKQFKSILFIDDKSLHAIGLNLSENVTIQSLFDYFQRPEFTIKLEIDKDRKDGVKVKFTAGS